MAHQPIDAAAFEPSYVLARRLAKHWRLSPNDRNAIEKRITATGCWDDYRWSRDGDLIARDTAEAKQARLGADGGMMRSAKACGWNRGLEMDTWGGLTATSPYGMAR